MFLKTNRRIKDGKEHRYWSVVENHRTKRGIVQRQVLYLGEINDSQKESWCKTIEVLERGRQKAKTVALFPEDRIADLPEHEVVKIKLSEMKICRPRQWGACWLACELWNQLKLNEFWSEKLIDSREGTSWQDTLQTMVSYRLIAPGSEWRLHRQWYGQSAMADLLENDDEVMPITTLYRCLDKLVVHKDDLFKFLRQRWTDLFGAEYNVLLYDLTSTYFECDPPEEGKRKFGYSRDKRSDCVQVVIALIVTKDGLPLTYEVMNGNTSEKTTLKGFLEKIETMYGKAHRVWLMDRGIPTEEVLAGMRTAASPVSYLVGTPRARLSKLEQEFLQKPWQEAQKDVKVKLLEKDEELYVLARSAARVGKERAMRRRKLNKYWKRLHALQKQKLTRDALLIKLGAAKEAAGKASHLVDVDVPKEAATAASSLFSFRLNREKLRKARRSEGHYLLRSNLCGHAPAELWQMYIGLTEVEQAFKELKNDLSIRPIYHQKDERIEAHIFVAFMAYCLQVTLKQRLRALAPGLTPRAVLEQFAKIQMVDVHLPTTDGRCVILRRYTQPEDEMILLLANLRLKLPTQPPPKITSNGQLCYNGL